VGKKAESTKQKAEIQADGLMGQTSGAGNTRSKSPAVSKKLKAEIGGCNAEAKKEGARNSKMRRARSSR
jgi:hypothetical protein